MKSFFRNSKEEEMIYKLKSLEVNPPSSLWHDIESTLKTQTRKRIVLITSWASAATVAILISVGSYLSLQNENPSLTSNSNETIPSLTIKKENPVNNNTALKNSTQKEIIIKNNVLIAEKLNFKSQEDQSALNQNNNRQQEKEQLFIQKINPKKAFVNNTLTYKELSIKQPSSITHVTSESRTNRPNGKWYFSASGFPVYSFHSAGINKRTGTEQESGLTSFGGSISVRYEFANKISIESGVTLGFMGQMEKNLYLVNSTTGNPQTNQNNDYTNNYGTLTTSNSNYTVMNTPVINNMSLLRVNESDFYKIDAYQKFRYLEIPLTISKGFSIKRFNLFVKGGLSAGVLVKNILDLQGDNIHLKGKTEGIDKYITTAITSFGISLPLYNKLNLIVEPSFKLSLKPLHISNTKTYPFSSYIKFGVELPL